MAGKVYLIPYVIYDNSLSNFSTSSMNAAQAAQWNYIVNANFNPMRVRTVNGYVNNYFGCTEYNAYVAFCNNNTSTYGVYYRGNIPNSELLRAFHRTYNPEFGYAKSDILDGIYYYDADISGVVSIEYYVELYATKEEAYNAIAEIELCPITYRDTNCVHNGPDSASPGDTVSVGYTFADGYGIANDSNIYVTNNGVLIPSQYSNGTLTFTMPDQS